MLKGAKRKYLVVRTHGLASHLTDPEDIRSWVFLEDERALFDKISPTAYGSFFEGPEDLLDALKVEEVCLRVNSIRARKLISLSRGTPIEDLIKVFMSKYDIENLRRIVFSLLFGGKRRELRLLPVEYYVMDVEKLSKADRLETLLELLEDRRLVILLSSWLSSSERDITEIDLALDRYYMDRLESQLKAMKIGKRSPTSLLLHSYMENVLLRNLLKAKYLGVKNDLLAKVFSKLPFRKLLETATKTDSLKEFLDELANLASYRAVSIEIDGAMKEVGEPWIIEHVIAKKTYIDSLRISLKGSMTEAYVLMYLISSEWESQSIKTILLGRMSGVDPEVLYNLLAPPTE
ncbi:MAG: V-type ATPase subunit [Candidatus Korarchaeota archaeon]|nr:V-type ATPase subunit [Candidatus Korarchaeota archaeon]